MDKHLLVVRARGFCVLTNGHRHDADGGHCPLLVMAVVERHISPDGLLALVVDRADDGDWSVGFDGFAWHTHGDSLEWSGYKGTPAECVRALVEDIIASQKVIVVSRVDGVIRDAWVADDPTQDELKYAEPNETIERRFWNSRPAPG